MIDMRAAKLNHGYSMDKLLDPILFIGPSERKVFSFHYQIHKYYRDGMWNSSPCWLIAVKISTVQLYHKWLRCIALEALLFFNKFLGFWYLEHSIGSVFYGFPIVSYISSLVIIVWSIKFATEKHSVHTNWPLIILVLPVPCCPKTNVLPYLSIYPSSNGETICR